MRRPTYTVIVLLLCIIAAVTWYLRSPATLPSGGRQSSAPPEQVLKRFLAAVYARDYATAYQWVSAKDGQIKSREEYLRENPSFSGTALRLTQQLAQKIEFMDMETKVAGDRAIVDFKVKLPNAGDPLLQEIFLDFDPDRLAALSAQERAAIERRIRALEEQAKLPTLEGVEQWELIKEASGWRVYLNWAGATTVLFEAKVMHGLPWTFAPLQGRVAAKPGETLQAVYTVRNLSDKTITAKARHIDEPEELAAKYLEIVQCFCFIQQTLAPGEEKELPLTFRIHWDIPDRVQTFRVTYEFYPIDKFPES